MLGVSCESSAWVDGAHVMPNVIFSEKQLKKKRMQSAAIVLSALRVKVITLATQCQTYILYVVGTKVHRHENLCCMI